MREKIEKLIALAVVLVGVVMPLSHSHPRPQAVAQLGAAPVPLGAPPDLTPAMLAISASAGYQSGALQSHDASIQTLWPAVAGAQADIAAVKSELAALPPPVPGPQGPVGPTGPMGATGPQGTPGAPGQSPNAPMVDTGAIVASTPPVSLVRSLCYPSQPFAGNIPTTGESIDFAFTVPAAGTYALQACVASLGGAHTYHVEFPVGTKLPSVTVVNTSSYQVFAYQSAGAVQLPAGPVTLRFVLENGGMNLAGFSYK
jgi:DUF5010 C-terminal domain